jgi:DNA processing protein
VAARLLPPEPKKAKGRADGAGLPDDISEGGRAVFRLIRAEDPVHIDALAEASGLGVPELAGALLELEMRELIRQLPGKSFVRKL